MYLSDPVHVQSDPEVSRLVLAPCICKCCNLKPASMIVGGASVASLSCLSASVWPTELPALILAVSGVALGVGPSYAMTITMAKERQQLTHGRTITSVDSAMFAVASSLGAGGVPFFMSRVLSLFGPQAFFPTLLGMSLALAVLTKLLYGSSRQTRQTTTSQKLKELSEVDTEASTYASYESDTSDGSDTSENLETTSSEERDMPVPPLLWTYWEQGWQNAPLVCQICIESWELLNPELALRKVCAADLPALLPELSRWNRLWELPSGQRSDLVRLALLQKYGGIWVDATLFSSAPIMPWLEGLKQRQQTEGEDSDETDGFFFVFQRDSESWPYDPFVKCKLPFLGCFWGHKICSTVNFT